MSVQGDIEERAFLIRRAREERALAATCEDNAVAIAHLKMADEYERRLRTGDIGLQAVQPD